MKELRKVGRWNFGPTVLEFRSGFMESMMITRPVVCEPDGVKLQGVCGTYGVGHCSG